MSSLTQLPEHILNKTAVVYLLGDILKEFDPANYEKATSKFRKPSYQRGIKKAETGTNHSSAAFLKVRRLVVL